MNNSQNSNPVKNPFMRRELTSDLKNRSKIFPIIGIFTLSCMFTLWIFAIYYLIYGSLITKGILTILLIYQYFIAKDRNEIYRNFLTWCKIQDYFHKYTLIIEEELDEKNSLLCSHPHGIINLTMGIALMQETMLYKFVICGTRFVRILPISGILARFAGIEGVDNRNFKTYMKNGKNICFVPGGFECASITNHTKDRVFIKKRKGFIKYCLQYGYKIHPCYGFNENKLFYTFNHFEKVRILFNKLKIPGCIFIGKYLMLPDDNLNLCTVIGKPLILPRIEKPTEEDIDKYQAIYIEELKSLYNRYKGEFGSSEELEIL
jgi:hypothetical protein